MRSKALDRRLTAYFVTLRSSGLAETLRRSAGNWQFYAAVTGSALAMTTNASAGVIYSGIQNISAGPIASAANPGDTFDSYKQILVRNGSNAIKGQFSFGPYQKFDSGGFLDGDANLNMGSKAEILITNANFKVKKLASGNNISNLAGGIWEGGTNHIASQHKGPGTNSHPGWSANQFGFAGFRISTVSHGLDYGWVRLEFTTGTNGATNGVLVEDWAFNTTPGALITAGQEVPSVPEPATGALALLALGAAGVTALRRKSQ
jgi:hypothetical protein